MTRDSTAPPAADTPPEPVPDLILDTGDSVSALPATESDVPGVPVPDANGERSLFSGIAENGDIDARQLDPDAIKVVLRLLQHGHQAYLVGGCVRDLLLGLKPKDFDVATSAHPGEVRAIFRNCRLIGRRFRLAHVYFRGGKIIEVSTFRANPTEVEEAQSDIDRAEGEAEGEENSSDERAPDDLLITHDNVFGTAEQDARRRDFTINGLFYDVSEGRVIDYVRGRRDLDERYIRTIGDPEVRMREDPIRILRAVRFACKLKLDLESRTYAAMEGAVEDLPRCAPPRLLEETFRLIRGGAAEASLKLLAALDALRILLPPIHEYLTTRGPEAEQEFYRFAQALDRRVCGGQQLEDAVLMAVLLFPLSRSQPAPSAAEGGRPSVARAVEELLQNFVQTARLPRRIAERCRLILIAQKTLTGERRRRGSLASFRSHPLFQEALLVFDLTVEATGEHREALEAWKSGGAPAVAAGAPSGPNKRRRRRRRSGAKGAASPGASAAPAESGTPHSSGSGPSDTGA